MEGIALHVGARHGRVEEAQIEGRVVADQDRAAAAVGAHRVADFAEDALQRVALRQRRPQRMVRVDAGDRERQRIQAGALKGLHLIVMRGATLERAVGVHVDECRRDLEQGIGGGMKPAGFHIDRDRQIAAEAP